MSTNVLNIKNLQLRNDTKDNWNAKNPLLLKGEMGIEIDTGKFKFGTGVKYWQELPYSGGVVGKSLLNGNILVDGAEVQVYALPIATSTTLGGVKSQVGGVGKVVVNNDGTLSIEEVAKAQRLTNTKTFSIVGDGTAEAVDFNGTENVELDFRLKNITLAKVSDAGSAASKNVGTSAGDVPILNSNGKLDDNVIPSLAIGDTFEVGNQAQMLALHAQKGDIAIRSDESKTYILGGDGDPNSLANWKLLKTPTGALLSVNGKTGAVTLGTTDIAEGTNLYYTEERATANFNTNIAETSVSDLKDGDKILTLEDTITLDCGNA